MNGSFQWTKWTIQQNKKKYFIFHWVNYTGPWMYEWMLRTTNEPKYECTKYKSEPNNQQMYERMNAMNYERTKVRMYETQK